MAGALLEKEKLCCGPLIQMTGKGCEIELMEFLNFKSGNLGKRLGIAQVLDNHKKVNFAYKKRLSNQVSSFRMGRH